MPSSSAGADRGGEGMMSRMQPNKRRGCRVFATISVKGQRLTTVMSCATSELAELYFPISQIQDLSLTGFTALGIVDFQLFKSPYNRLYSSNQNTTTVIIGHRWLQGTSFVLHPAPWSDAARHGEMGLMWTAPLRGASSPHLSPHQHILRRRLGYRDEECHFRQTTEFRRGTIEDLDGLWHNHHLDGLDAVLWCPVNTDSGRLPIGLFRHAFVGHSWGIMYTSRDA
jgi:hypothetical protein